MAGLGREPVPASNGETTRSGPPLTDTGTSPASRALDYRRIFCERRRTCRASNSPRERGGGAVETGGREIFVPRSGIDTSAADDGEFAKTGSRRPSVPALCCLGDEWPSGGSDRKPAASYGATPIGVFTPTRQTPH